MDPFVPDSSETPDGPARIALPAWVQAGSLALLALLASITGVINEFVQDDLPIIVASPTLHSLARPWRFFTQAWWPDPFPRELYRPLTSTLLAVEYTVGGGKPLLFKIGSILLYMVATVMVWQLVRRLASPTAAWLAGALFAVHPVHVEAVAVAVNQAEMLVAIMSIALTISYVRRRQQGLPLRGRWLAVMAVGYAAAALFKESGVMVPALLLAAEVTLVTDPRPWGRRIADSRFLFLVLALVAVVVLGARNLALAGNTKGTFTAEALVGLGLGGRAITMLGVVPVWARLFVWPAHLQADYSPGEIVGTTHWGAMQSLGLAILLAVVAIAWWGRRRWPRITFGILWIAIGLFPVSNVLVATGIVVAERTLFLATVGVVLIGGVLLAPVVDRLMAHGSLARIATATGLTLLLGMGLWRSASRQMVWHDLTSLWYQTVIDAPLSYRAHHAYAQILFKAGSQASGELEYRRAIQLYPQAWPVYIDLADKYRLAGKCDPAIKLYRALLALSPAHAGGRASLIACLVYDGHYAEAAREARLGESFGLQARSFRLYEQVADSAQRVDAPIHTVTLPPPLDSATADPVPGIVTR